MKLTKTEAISLNLLTLIGTEPIKVKDLATKLDTQARYLQNIVTKLKKANLINVKQGIHGGVFKSNGIVQNPNVLQVLEALGRSPTVSSQGFSSQVTGAVSKALADIQVPNNTACHGEGNEESV